MLTLQVENIDRILDELEELARSDLPSSRFFGTLVERIRLTVQAKSVVLLLPVLNTASHSHITGKAKLENQLPNTAAVQGNSCQNAVVWLPIATSGEPWPAITDELCKKLSGHLEREPEVLLGSGNAEPWIATPLRPRGFSRGCLAVRVEHPLPQHAVASFIELMTAFSEVAALRQTSELESFLDEYWEPTQALCSQIRTTEATDEACVLLATGLAHAVGAARVTVLTANTWGSLSLRSISGVPQVEPRSKSVQALKEIGSQVLQSGKPLLLHCPLEAGSRGEPLPAIDDSGKFQNLIGTRLSSNQQSPTTLIVLEYANYSDLVASATKLPHLLPTISGTWEQHVRWLRLPPIARSLLATRMPRAIMLPWLKWVGVCALLVLGVWLGHMPTAMIIEADGAYEPIISRAIYSSDDGFIEHLLVDDGQAVEVGQPLVQLRSPTLELRIEQTQGEIRSLEEERIGIRIAMNQLDPDASDLLSNQSRMAAKIAELQAKQQSLKKQVVLLDHQRARLTLKAPIAGVVVAKDIQQHLLGRPVRRGDALFSIVDLYGPWHIRIQVADRDTRYLTEYYAPSEPSGFFPDVSSSPTEIAAGQPATRIALPVHASRMPEHGTLTADVVPQAAEHHSTLREDIEFVMDSAPDKRFPARVYWIAEQIENEHASGCYLEVRAGTDPHTIPANFHAGAGVHAFFKCGQQPLWFVWCRPMIEALQRRLWFRNDDKHE